ncbi:MAG: Ig-like domain-containing protein, partial [Candidatus Hydrogenedentales bacterium]
MLPGNSILVTFSKSMDTTSVKTTDTASILFAKQNGENWDNVGLTNLNWSVNDTVLNASPTVRLEQGGTYRVTVTGGDDGAKDATAANNPMAENFEWVFHVHDRVGIASVLPYENQVDVATTTEFVLELMKTTGSNPSVSFRAIAGTGYNVNEGENFKIDPVSLATWADNKATINPTDFPNNTLVQVTVSGLVDNDGYSIDYGFGDGKFIYTFNTATQPIILTASPTAGVTGVPVGDPIVVTFSKAMSKTVTTVEVKDSDDAVITTIPEWNTDGTALFVYPAVEDNSEKTRTAWKYNVEYSVTVDTNSTDAQGNVLFTNTTSQLNGLKGAKSNEFSFTTVDEEDPIFGSFALTRDRTKLTASYAVSSNAGPAITKYGFAIKKGEGEDGFNNEFIAEITDENSKTVKVTVDGSEITMNITEKDGHVSATFTGFVNNAAYEIKPRVVTEYGDYKDTGFAGDAKSFVIHPWNLEDNATDLAKTITTGLSVANPFIIADIDDYRALATTTEAIAPYWTNTNLRYLQIADIDITSTSDVVSISTSGNKFAAQYNGAGFTITGGTVPMFAALDTGATIENVVLTGVAITEGTNVGGIVAVMSGGTVKNSSVAGTISGTNAGGIAGSVTGGTISGSTNDATVTGSTAAGCIAGVKTGGDLSNNVCLKHEHRPVIGQTATHQTYLAGLANVAPVIELASTTIPANSGAWTEIIKDIGTSTQLVFTFSKPMKYTETEDAFSLKVGETVVPVTFAWSMKTDDSASVLTVTPKSPLGAASTYTAAFTNAKDIFGNEMTSDDYKFTVSADVTVEKVTVHTVHGSETNKDITYRVDTADVPVNASFTIKLNGALAEGKTITALITGRNLNTNAALDAYAANHHSVTLSEDRKQAYVALADDNKWAYAASHTMSITTTNANDNAFTYNYHFTTASQPVVIGHSPADKATLALTNGAITIAFSKPMDAEITQTAITLKDSENKAVTLGNWVWSADGTTVTATPTTRLATSTEYTVTVAATAQDNDDYHKNTLHTLYTWTFETGGDSGIENIYAAESSNGKTRIADTYNVATDSLLIVEFKDKLNANQKIDEGDDKRPVFTLRPEAGDVVTVAVDWNNDIEPAIASLTPNTEAKLKYDTTYTLTVSELYDANGFALDNVAYSFKTASQPCIISVVPVADKTNVEVTDKIVVTFSKAMNKDSVEKALDLSGKFLPTDKLFDLTTSDSLASYSIAWTGGNKVMTITPANTNHAGYTGQLDFNATYSLNIGNTAQDSLGNTIHAPLVKHSFSTVGRIRVDNIRFAKTEGLDLTDIPVASMTATDNGITVTFADELTSDQQGDVKVAVKLTVKSGTTEVVKTVKTDGNEAERLTASWAVDHKTLTIVSTQNLLYNASCTLEIGALTDDRGEPTGKPAKYHFQTTARPVVIGHSPADGAKLALTNGAITVVFSRPMDRQSVQDAIELKEDGQTDAISLDNWVWSADGTTVIATPTERLKYKTNYTVTVGAGAKDALAAGNEMASVVTWTFTTGGDSGIESIYAAESSDGKTRIADTYNVATDSLLIVEFKDKLNANQKIDEGDDKRPVFTLKPETGDAVTVTTAWDENAAHSIASLTPNTTDKLAYDTTYTLTVSELYDANGFKLDNVTYSFKTASQPYIITVVPSGSDVKVTDKLVVTFSKAMKPTTVEEALTLSGKFLPTNKSFDLTTTPEPASYTVAWSGGNKVMTITPKGTNHAGYDGQLDFNATYSLDIGAGAKDSLGNDIHAHLVKHSFSTVGRIRVDDISFVRTDNLDLANIPVASMTATDNGITVTFADELTVSQKNTASGAVKLTASGGEAGTVAAGKLTVSWAEDNKTLTINSVNELDYNASYTLEIGGLTDDRGVPTGKPAKYYFQTTARPVVTSISPADKSKFALTNGLIVVGFSKAMDTTAFNANKHLLLQKYDENSYETITDGLSTTLTWDEAGRTVTASPAARLAYNAKYQVVVIQATADIDGNTMLANHEWTFETGARSDISSIELKYGDNLDKKVDNPFDAPVDSQVVITFAEALNDDQQNSVVATITSQVKSSGGATSGPTKLEGEDAVKWTDNKVLTLSLNGTTDLNHYTKYTVEIGNLMDANGYVLPDVITYEFQTASQPCVLDITPASGTVNVKVTDPIVITFSKAMNTTVTGTGVTLASQTFPAETTTDLTNSDTAGTNNYSTSWSADNRVLTLTPNNAAEPHWQYNASYTLSLTTELKDSVDNALNAALTGYSFLTVGRTQIAVDENGKKMVELVDSTADAQDLPIAYLKDSGLKITFSDALTETQRTAVESGLIIKGNNDYTLAETKTWTDNKTLTVKITDNCAYSETITLTVGGLTDDRGVKAAEESFTFKTTAQPVVTSVSPASGTTVLPGNSILVTFSKSMKTDSVTANVALAKKGTDDGWTDIGLTNLNWSVNDTVLNASPSARLEAGETYKVTVTNAVTDADNNKMLEDFSWQFTVHAKTGVASVLPYENQVDVATNTEFVLELVKAADEANRPKVTFEGTGYELKDQALTWTDKTGKITPADLTPDAKPFPYNTVIKVTISGLVDGSGYPLDYGFGDGVFQYTFNTATQPIILTASPTAGVNNVPVGDPIVVTFSKAMSKTATTVEVKDSDDAAITTISEWNTDGTALFVYPAVEENSVKTRTAWKYGVTYSVTVSDTATDAQGNVLFIATDSQLNGLKGAKSNEFSFTTVVEQAPIFGNFALSRDRTTLTASYVVSSKAGPAITQYGFAIKKDSGEFNNAFTGAIGEQPVEVTVNDVATMIMNVDANNGQVSATFTGLDNGVSYEIKPRVLTEYGTGHYEGDSALKFKVHPWNLVQNYDGSNLTAAVSSSNPFVVETADDLKAVAVATATAYYGDHFAQIKDLTIDGWDTPIGNNTNAFTGTYSGMGITISSAVTSANTTPFGLFGKLDTGAKVSNINLTLSNKFSSAGTIGGIAGQAAGTASIENCRV